jgi:hypothetical protein
LAKSIPEPVREFVPPNAARDSLPQLSSMVRQNGGGDRWGASPGTFSMFTAVAGARALAP